MCGIIGIIGDKPVTERIIKALKRLEYRGYDSAGIAVIEDGEVERVRAEGKIKNLEEKLKTKNFKSSIGVGHTRWATHGAPSVNNAHPHASDKTSVVHNGIIENFLELRKDLQKTGVKFKTDTDTEVVPHLVDHFFDQNLPIEQIFRKVFKKLQGAFALGVILDKNTLVAVKQGSPLAIGYGEGQMFLGSDALALSPFTTRISYLEDGDIAVLSKDNVKIFDEENNEIKREIKQILSDNFTASKGEYRHYMLKEIYEQPSVVGTCIKRYCNPVTGKISFDNLVNDVEYINIIACGTSFYAGMVARYLFNHYAKIDARVEIASEFRYLEPKIDKNSLNIFISQSGETADTLAALHYIKKQGAKTLAITNVEESSIARESDLSFQTYAGPEIGVASTKAFTTQIIVLSLLIIEIAKKKNLIDENQEKIISRNLGEVSSNILEVLHRDDNIIKVARILSKANSILYVGRNVLYPIALEGALKLKELSYIHSEASAAGELKHGTIALIDEKVPVIALAPSGEEMLFDKIASNIREIASRNGKIILISDKKGIEDLQDVVSEVIELPTSAKETAILLNPILYTIPIQLLAYHTAVIKGTDVDQPRNLAKSVTVE